MVIKRFNILFNTQLRQLMEEREELRNCYGIHEALRFINAVLAMHLHPEHKSDYQTCDEGLAKYFDGTHCEYDTLVGFVRGAYRIEAILNYDMGIHEYIAVQLLFFEKRQRKGQEKEIRITFKTINGFPNSIMSMS